MYEEMILTDESLYIRVDSNKEITLLFADYHGPLVNRETAMIQDLQDFFDVRQRRSDLPDDDPDKDIDPAKEHIFWDGADLVSRSVKVANLRLDDQGIIIRNELELEVIRP